MREILFRGRNENSTWIYGSLLVDKDTFDKNAFIYYICDIDGYSMEIVNTKTIGQFTGLNDKNGIKIFEGDVVKFIDIDFDGSERKAVGVIAWNRKAANFDIVKGTYRLDFHYQTLFEEIEVIGNVHDNLDLIKA